MEEKEIKEIIAYAIDYCQRKGTNISTQEVFDEYIKGTEDEKIKKTLIHLVTANKELYSGIDNFDGIKRTILQEWLERQRERKVEPKFHEGEWCIDEWDKCVFKITKVLDNTYRYETTDGKEYNTPHYELENDSRLWTIKDAKDGDVLVTNDSLACIYNGYLEEQQWPFAYCGINIYGRFNISYGLLPFTHQKVVPATKEQCDLLFQKMEEAGYAFDFKNKELKKIEQKTA